MDLKHNHVTGGPTSTWRTIFLVPNEWRRRRYGRWMTALELRSGKRLEVLPRRQNSVRNIHCTWWIVVWLRKYCRWLLGRDTRHWRHGRRARRHPRTRQSPSLVDLKTAAGRVRSGRGNAAIPVHGHIGTTQLTRLPERRRWRSCGAAPRPSDVDGDLLCANHWCFQARSHLEFDFGLRRLLHRSLGFVKLPFKAFLSIACQFCHIVRSTGLPYL